MDDKVVIDCIGPSVLIITISGDAHSVPLASNVISISDTGGGVEHNLDSLPLVYDAADLGGRLTICDEAGKMIYCWRSSVMLQSRLSGFAQGRSDRSSFSSLGPDSPIEMTTPDSSLAPASSNGSNKRGIISERIGDTRRMSTASSTAMVTPSGKVSHNMTDSQNSISDDGLEEPAKKPEGPVNEELVVRFGRYLRELKRKGQLAELQERTLCRECGYVPFDPLVTSCFHVFCKECLVQLLRKASEASEAGEAGEDKVPRPKCGDIVTEVQSCEGLIELLLDNTLEPGGQVGRKNGRKSEESYIDLADEDTDQSELGFTQIQKGFLVNSINKLLKLSFGEFFRQPANHDDLSSKAMDLKTIRTKLRDSLYPSIEALKADFDRMEHNSVIRYGLHHKNTKDAQNLKAAFERYMTDYPGLDEDSAPRKKAKTTGSKTPPAQIPARGGASSPPRAAKRAMQGRKYPRDHW